VGRRRRKCCFAKDVGCPILASLFERSRGWLQGGSTSFVIATRHEQPCPCTVAFCSPLVPRCDQPATVPRPPISAAPRATGIRRVRSFLPPAPMSASHRAGIESLPPAGTIHARQSLRLVPVMDRARLPRARPPLLRRCGRAKKQVFGRQSRPGGEESLARRRRQCLCASGGPSLPGRLEKVSERGICFPAVRLLKRGDE